MLRSCISKTRIASIRNFSYPLVIEREGGGERSYDIFSRLLKDRIVCIMGGITDPVAASTVSQLLFLASDNPDAPIKIYINSPGGVVTSGMAIYDCMQLIPSPIETWCLGQAASMGSLLLTAGTPGQRYALPNSRIMIHQPLGGARGQASDIRIQADEILYLKERLNVELSERTGKELDTIKEDTDRDFYMSPQEAVDYGLIDLVLDKKPIKNT
jgi:ATP-dependent Clp protease protease subunit